MTCPDREMISLWRDGELPEPWKDAIAAHIEKCPACRAVTAAYENLDAALRTDAASLATAAREAEERVWARLLSEHNKNTETAESPLIMKEPRSLRFPSRRPQRRYVNLPVRAFALSAAAGIAAVFALAFLLGQNFAAREMRNPSEPAIALEAHDRAGYDRAGHDRAEFDAPPLPVSSMSDVRRYLDTSAAEMYPVLSLPAQNFYAAGTPQIMKVSTRK